LTALIQKKKEKKNPEKGQLIRWLFFPFQKQTQSTLRYTAQFTLTVVDGTKLKQKLLVYFSNRCCFSANTLGPPGPQQCNREGFGLLGDTQLLLPDTCTAELRGMFKHSSCQSTGPLQLCSRCLNVLLGNTALQLSEALP